MLGHYSTYMDYQSWNDWIWSWHMPLFFLVGGFVFAQNETRYLKMQYTKYIKKQIQNTLVPYTIFFLISVFVHYIALPFLRGQTLGITGVEIKKILIAFFLSGGYLETVKINNFALWFLPLYFIAKCTYYLLVRILKKNQMIYYICIILIFFVTIPFQQFVCGRPAYHINVLPVAIVFMAIGATFCKIEDKMFMYREIQENMNEVFACVCIYIGIIISYYYPGNVGGIENGMYILGACATVLGIYILAGYYNGTILEFFGKNSIIILGLHSLIGGLFRNFVEGNLMKKWDGPLLNFILVSLQLIVMGIICICWKKTKNLLKNMILRKE